MHPLFIFLIFHFGLIENPIQPWGADSELATGQNREISINQKVGFGSKACSKMIRFFQKYISPIDGPRSNFYPTSSEYTRQAIQKYGVLKGIAMGCDRLLRENDAPWVYNVKTREDGTQKKCDPVR